MVLTGLPPQKYMYHTPNFIHLQACNPRLQMMWHWLFQNDSRSSHIKQEVAHVVQPRTAVWFFQLTDLLAAAHIVSQMTKGMAVCASSFDFMWFLYAPQTLDRLREPSPLSLMLKRDTTQGRRVWKSLPFQFDKADIVPGSWGAKTLCLKYSCSLHGGQYHLNNIIFGMFLAANSQCHTVTNLTA